MSLSQQLVISISLLIIAGLIMIFNASSAEALDLSQPNTHQALLKQLFYCCAGAIFAYVLSRIGYRFLFEKSWLLLLGSSLLLLLVLIPGIGISVNGSRRWIGFGSWRIQPSEFVKYLAPIAFTKQLIKLHRPTFTDFVKCAWPFGIPVGLIFLEPNNGTVCVLGVSLAVSCFLTKVPLRFWALPLACCALLGTLCALKMPYVSGRIQTYLHPERDLRGKGHQPYQAKIASGSGGLFGKGPGKSMQKLSYLPEAQNDYIAAIFAEEYGFFGMLCLLALYSWLVIIGFGIAIQAETMEAKYIASTITFLITFQAFLNMGVVSGLLPSTGLNLPFFSQGGSSLLAHMAASGILISISKESEKTGTCLITSS